MDIKQGPKRNWQMLPLMFNLRKALKWKLVKTSQFAQKSFGEEEQDLEASYQGD